VEPPRRVDKVDIVAAISTWQDRGISLVRISLTGFIRLVFTVFPGRNIIIERLAHKSISHRASKSLTKTLLVTQLRV